MEAMNKAVLDCGASGTVCGDVWMNCYIDSLDEKERNKIVYKVSHNKFKFGDGEKVCSQQLVKIPALIGQKKIFIETDVVKKDIPLLLSKKSMKKADTELNFRDDTVTMLNQKIDLQVTRSGHYTIPLDQNQQIIEKVDRKETVAITLLNSNNMSYKDIAIKLHRQFAHPAATKLLKLIKHTDKDVDELKEQIISVSKSCKFCREYKKPPPRPVVGLPVATSFNQCVAMDLR